VASYGPINKTTIATTDDGTTVRRMPNLVKFKDDPDAMLVMSLEHYDEVTCSATKAAIMHQDVVGRQTPITSVQSAEAGLLVCLDHRGAVDLPYIATLYDKGVREIIAELGDLLYQDPDTQAWETADAYLSGNVRAKLAAAECAGEAFARNVEPLRLVQPEDVLPGDIDAHLGAPWIPEADIQAFAAALFGVSPHAVQIAHLKKDAVWSIEPGLDAVRSVAATTDYGTERANGVWLLEQALNLRTPVIYDTVVHDGKEERVLNQEETLAAREKQKGIKEQFKGWLFTDPDRTERLVRLYNDMYNNLRLRAFDGSHLVFPGMNQAITLQPHQKAAVWRVMSSGNTLLAHAVGAGKTYEMAAAGMKMKQAGLITKPLYVVPNHMLEQFGREFMQLYPNARLLVAGKEDFTRDRRKLLTAKMASGTWDGSIVTHSSFERIGMSRDYQERFLREQITEYDQLLCDSAAADTSRAHRNIIKTVEKQKAKREERLKDLLAEEKKDDGLVFDELGVDHIFIDESHYFKNLETPTKMERVAGIQTSGSERAFDLYMKARSLHQQHPGHGVTFATGTPISNTMVEMYTIQRYLDPDGLSERGIDHFDAWAATFGEVIDTMEISPDGKSLRPRSRFAKFSNLPELQQMFRAFADVQTADMLDLPRPRLKGEKASVIACPMSDAQEAIQDSLVDRYEAIRSGKVKPWEDNALAITTAGRKLALDARLLSPHADDFPGSKINALVQQVSSIWQATGASRGTQLIFSDMGVNPTQWGYGVYGEIIDKLVKAGLPRHDIATIGDADTDAKKQVLFEKVRAGSVRVLLGSTQKMGTGTNVQQRLVALHHLDAPWKPAEVEQRDGRMLRQGNRNAEVAIYRYVTEGSFDAYMWQALETKARFIAQVMTGSSTVRRAEDSGGQELSYAEVKAIASGNPAVLTLAEADAELQRLAVLKKHHADEQFLARRKLRELPVDIARLERRRDALAQDIATATAHASDPISIGERRYSREDALDALALRLTTLPALVPQTHTVPLGVYRGLTFRLVLHPQGTPDICVEGALTRVSQLARDFHGPRAILNAVERLVGSAATEREKTVRDLGIAQGQRRDYEARLGAACAHTGYLDELADLRNQLEAALSSNAQQVADAPLNAVEEIVERIKTLKAAHSLEAAPERTTPRSPATVEEAITTRIRQREQTETAPLPEAMPAPGAPATPAPLPATAPAPPAMPAQARPAPWAPPQQLRLF
jgi:N12 class adenine-specific DNA methylase